MFYFSVKEMSFFFPLLHEKLWKTQKGVLYAGLRWNKM